MCRESRSRRRGSVRRSRSSGRSRRRCTNIGEHVYNLSEEFKKAHPDILWTKIAGLRHRLVHHYEDTNWIVICAIIFDVLPEFLEELKGL